MPKKIAIGIQDFEKIRMGDFFYVDKTSFIREWWESGDEVTLITRPRRFGKTLNMSMLECFFSNRYEGRGDLFEGLAIWNEGKYREMQGSYPVIFLSFAGVKADAYEKTRRMINQLIRDAYNTCAFVTKEPWFAESDKEFFSKVGMEMDDTMAFLSIRKLCEWLYRHYGKKCIILLDEYDTPMQEAYIHGYWDEIVSYTRAFFNNTFKTNPALERAVMTGITRVSKESIFSDLNNLKVITTTSDEYAAAFGFTEEEVFAAMDDQGIDEGEKETVKRWYDGFTFGMLSDIYNPWSVIMYLDERKVGTYWANTSSNGLVGKIIREGDKKLKEDFETLLAGGCIESEIDEQIIFNQLHVRKGAAFSLLLASGYLKVVWHEPYRLVEERMGRMPRYRLALTNLEVRMMFESMVVEWFDRDGVFSEFVAAMLQGNVREMNYYMNKVALNTFSYFDAGKKPSEAGEPEKFYHGFVLGLMADQAGGYVLKSNRESGFGRYDVVMEPKDVRNPAVIIEFKVRDLEYDGEKELADTARNALRQIEERQYEADLVQKGVAQERILKYGFAFEGKKCLIMKG